ncbi:MAG: YitT family protein [Clostridia bacterium]|nr:YitT family protein [Clostridia bacterium]
MTELIKKYGRDYFLIILGSFVVALGINLFLLPCKISTGGVSGIATVVYYFFNVPLSVTTLIINVFLFLFGYKTLPKAAIVKTVAGIVFLSLFLEITDFHIQSDDLFLASVFGGVLVGLGVGLTVMVDASTGGSDFAAIMINRLVPHLSVANIIMFIDCGIIAFSAVVFKNYTLMLYSAVSLYIASKVTNFVLVRGDFAKSVYIISKNSSLISKEIINGMSRGVTGIYSKGLYNNSDNMMLMCVVRSRELPVLMDKIRAIDKNAFTVISEVREVHGEGFKQL